MKNIALAFAGGEPIEMRPLSRLGVPCLGHIGTLLFGRMNCFFQGEPQPAQGLPHRCQAHPAAMLSLDPLA